MAQVRKLEGTPTQQIWCFYVPQDPVAAGGSFRPPGRSCYRTGPGRATVKGNCSPS